MHIIIGMALPNRKTPRVEFVPRDSKNINVSTPLPPEMHKARSEYCDARRNSQASLIRYLLQRALGLTQHTEKQRVTQKGV